MLFRRDTDRIFTGSLFKNLIWMKTTEPFRTGYANSEFKFMSTIVENIFEKKLIRVKRRLEIWLEYWALFTEIMAIPHLCVPSFHSFSRQLMITSRWYETWNLDFLGFRWAQLLYCLTFSVSASNIYTLTEASQIFGKCSVNFFRKFGDTNVRLNQTSHMKNRIVT